MSASRGRRRSVASSLAILSVGVLLLAGCGGQKDPGSYTNGVKTSFTAACWTQRVLDQVPSIKVKDSDSLDQRSAIAQKAAPKVAKAAQGWCTCVYKALTKTVRFGEFKRINDSMRDQQGMSTATLPKSFTDAYKSCPDTTATATKR